MSVDFWDLWAHVWEALGAFWEALGAFWKLQRRFNSASTPLQRWFNAASTLVQRWFNCLNIIIPKPQKFPRELVESSAAWKRSGYHNFKAAQNPVGNWLKALLVPYEY